MGTTHKLYTEYYVKFDCWTLDFSGAETRVGHTGIASVEDAIKYVRDGFPHDIVVTKAGQISVNYREGGSQ